MPPAFELFVSTHAYQCLILGVGDFEADGKPLMDDRLTFLIRDLALNEEQRFTGGERGGKTHGRGLLTAEGNHQLEIQPPHDRMQIPEEMYVRPVALFGAGVVDGL